MKIRALGWSVGLAAALQAGTAFAAGGAGMTLFGGDFSYNGLIRLETAFSTTGQAAQVNQVGDPANGQPINRQAGNPFDGWLTPIAPGTAILSGTLNNISANIPIVNVPSIGGVRGVTNDLLVSDTHTRYVPKEHPVLNYHLLRFEATPTLSWGDYSLQTRIRAVYDPGDLGYEDFTVDDYRGINGGLSGGVRSVYTGDTNRFEFPVRGKRNPILFEHSARNYMVDLPAFFGQWTNGQTTVRVGNQTVAWGQLLFFRVFDTANGLDLRRHLIIDRGIEEYADERMSSPGIRITHQVNNEIVADAFVNQFIPTVLTNINTPYNVIPSQFIVEDRYHEGNYDQKVDYGIRIKGDYGKFVLQAMATRRYNPLGAIRWTTSNVNKALPNTNALGAAFNKYCSGLLAAQGRQSNNGCGPILANTAFEVGPAGVFTAEEWFSEAGYIKLDALDGLNKAVDDFPDAQLLFAQSIGQNAYAANNELDAFFIAGEGLHGHIERRYFQETVYGLGGGYVIDAEPGSILDQMIINVEGSYTPNKTLTAVDLRKEFKKTNDTQIGLVVEKYQRFSTEFPATYLVFQYLWQQQTDLFGLDLDGYGSENFSDQGVKLNKNVPTSDNPRINPGLSSANYLVFAFLQPWPAYIWELSAAALVDVQGGLLIQPGLQYKPRGNITINVFYNFLTGQAWGNNSNKNIINLIDHNDELAIRLGYQF